MAIVHNPKSSIPAKLKGLHLFHFDGAPCAQRVRFALAEKGLFRSREENFDDVSETASLGDQVSWVSRSVSLVKKDHMTATYAAIHPNMVVPALVHDGRLYLESLDIICYLDEAFGGSQLVPSEPESRALTMNRVEEAKTLHRSVRFVSFYWGLGRLAMLNPRELQKLKQLAESGNDGEQLVEFYNGYSSRTIPESTYVDHLNKLYSAFNEREKEFSDGRLFLMGDELSIADAFWAMKVLRLFECGYPFSTYHPKLWQWFNLIREKPSFQREVMSHKFAHHAFRVKAKIESLLGIGLKQAVQRLVKEGY